MKVGSDNDFYISFGYFQCLFMKWTFYAFLIMFSNIKTNCIIVAFYKSLLAVIV